MIKDYGHRGGVPTEPPRPSKRINQRIMEGVVYHGQTTLDNRILL